jgi:CRP-like cAMP-binding protein
MNPVQLLTEKIEQAGLWEKSLSLLRNEYLKVKGSTDTNLYFILSGSLRIFVVDEYEEHTIRFGYQNNFIASLDSFISEKPSELFIQALKKTELKVISKKTYLEFISEC